MAQRDRRKKLRPFPWTYSKFQEIGRGSFLGSRTLKKIESAKNLILVLPHEVIFAALEHFWMGQKLATRQKVSFPKSPKSQILTGHIWSQLATTGHETQRTNFLGPKDQP